MNIERNRRIADQVRRELARLLREEVRDPRVGFVTLTDVALSSDLRHARVFFTMMDHEDHEESVRALNHAVPFLRKSLARNAGLRFTPQLKFIYDESLDTGLRVDRLLGDVLSEGPDDAT